MCACGRHDDTGGHAQRLAWLLLSPTLLSPSGQLARPDTYASARARLTRRRPPPRAHPPRTAAGPCRAGGRAVPGVLGPFRPRTPGESPARRGPSRSQNLSQNTFLSKTKKARRACFFAAKSKKCYKVAEKLRNVFGTTSRTRGVQIGPKLAELRPKNRLKRPLFGVFSP